MFLAANTTWDIPDFQPYPCRIIFCKLQCLRWPNYEFGNFCLTRPKIRKLFRPLLHIKQAQICPIVIIVISKNGTLNSITQVALAYITYIYNYCYGFVQKMKYLKMLRLIASVTIKIAHSFGANRLGKPTMEALTTKLRAALLDCWKRFRIWQNRDQLNPVEPKE